MRRKKKIAFILIVLVFILTGCSSGKKAFDLFNPFGKATKNLISEPVKKIFDEADRITELLPWMNPGKAETADKDRNQDADQDKSMDESKETDPEDGVKAEDISGDEEPEESGDDKISLLRSYIQECLAQEENLSGREDKKFIVCKEQNPYGNFISNYFTEEYYGYTGILTAGIWKNEQDEPRLLMIRLEENPEKEEYSDRTITSLKAFMYQVEGGNVSEVDEIILSDDFSYVCNNYKGKVFVKETDEGLLLGYELNGLVFIQADGADNVVQTYRYRNDHFEYVDGVFFSGSAWEPEDNADYVKRVRSMGWDMQECSFGTDSRSVVDQDAQVLCLAEVNAQVTLDISDYYSLRSFTVGSRAECGYTRFSSRVGDDYLIEFQEPRDAQPESGAVMESQTSSVSEYIIPDSSIRELSDAEIAAVPDDLVQLAINEIYARNGRRFKNEEIQEYFNSKSWYVPQYSPDEFKDSRLTEIERRNIQKLSKRRK